MSIKSLVTIAATLVAALIVGLLVLVFARTVKAAPVYPPMVGGEFEFRVQAVAPLDGDGVPTEPLTRAISIVPQEGGAPIVCTDAPDPVGIYTIRASVAATGVRQAFKAFAYAEPACGGLVSEASENTAYTFPGMSPHRPDLQ